MSLDPAMAALAARTAAAWRAEQDQRPDALPLVTAHTARILIPALQALRPELAHFAGAAHRDPIALAVVQEWQLDREASEDMLRERGRARRGGGR